MSEQHAEHPKDVEPAPAKDRRPRRRAGARMGIYVVGEGAEWTALHIRGEHREELGLGSESPAAETPPPAAWASYHGSESALVLPSAEALFRIVRLPSVDPVELRGMAELQLDEISPFPVEQLVLSCAPLLERDGQTQLLIAAMRRERLLNIADQWMGHRWRPHRVELDLWVWWRSVLRLPVAEHAARTLHIRFIPGGCWFIVTQDGQPILIRVMTSAPVETPILEDLLNECGLSLAVLEQNWGVRECDLWVWDAPAGSWASELSEGLGMPAVEQHTPAEFRVSRAALEGADFEHPDPHAINLALPEWGRDRIRKNFLRKTVIGLSAALLAWLIALGGLFVYVRLAAADADALEKEVVRAEKPARAVRETQDRIAALDAHTDQRRTALEMLRLVSEPLPHGARLTSFSFNKGKSLQLRGETVMSAHTYAYIKALEESGIFHGVTLEGINDRSRATGSVSEFRVICELEAPAS
ncbi:MAG: hypothetical protein KBA51_00395 [Kiritimatiellae bacterium]|nr:hypothetical protein [Kiritimatiellia bacterium]